MMVSTCRKLAFFVGIVIGPSLVVVVDSLTLNIHLPLKAVQNQTTELCPYSFALQANLALRQNFPGTEQVDFFQTHTPHLTLYLTDFGVGINNKTDVINKTKLESILKVAQTTILKQNNTEPCPIDWPNSTSSFQVHGSYAMVAIPKNACLQTLSDHLVYALRKYIQRPVRIPDWIYDLPLLQRWQKLFLAEKYGSPNVLSQFDPHVTVGYDEETSPEDRRKVLMNLIQPTGCHAGGLDLVDVANVGVGGTVLKDGVLKHIPLNNDNNTHEGSAAFIHKKTATTTA